MLLVLLNLRTTELHMKQQNARSLSETDACPAWQILLQCRRPDADGAVSEGKKTKNIKHSGNLTKNVFLDLRHYRAHFRLCEAAHYQAVVAGHLPPDAQEELGKGVQGHCKGVRGPSMLLLLVVHVHACANWCFASPQSL